MASPSPPTTSCTASSASSTRRPGLPRLLRLGKPQSLASIKKIDDLTVQFVLDPTGASSSNSWRTTLTPSSPRGRTPHEGHQRVPIGTGPLEGHEGYTPGRQIEFAANPNYSGVPAHTPTATEA